MLPGSGLHAAVAPLYARATVCDAAVTLSDAVMAGQSVEELLIILRYAKAGRIGKVSTLMTDWRWQTQPGFAGPHGGAMRPVSMGRVGAVASACPLASLVGLDVLREGGNAFDAAVATSDALRVCDLEACRCR